MAACDYLGFNIFLWNYQTYWNDLCKFNIPDISYDDFLTGMSMTYATVHPKQQLFNDYSTQLYNYCLSGSSSAHGHTDIYYWSGNTDGSTSNTGLTGTKVGIGTSTPNKPLTVVGDISGTTDLYIGDNIRGLRGQFGDSPVDAGPIRDLDIRNSGSAYLRLESLTNANQIIEFMNNQEPDFYIQNKFGDGGLIIGSDNKQFLIIGANDDDTIDLYGNTTISGNTTLSGNTLYSGTLSGTGSVTTVGNLGVSGRTYIGTIDAAGASYSNNKLLVAQSNGEVEYLTTAELKADIADADYWSANTDGSISPSGITTNVGVGTTSPRTKLDVHHNPTDLADNTGGGEVVTFGSGTLVKGKLHYMNTSGAWVLTDADATGTGGSQLLGIALGTSVSVGVLLRGFFDMTSFLGPGAFNQGVPLYVSGTAGSIAVTQPAGSADFVRVVGYCTNTANVIYFNPDGTYIKIA